MKISVMWMTRKRSYELVYSLTSFINNADDNTNIEYHIAIDSDDSETADALEKINLMCFAQNATLICHIIPERYGYAELEQYQNVVGEKFTGECLIILNDDLICIEQGWDTKIRESIEPFQELPAWIGIVPINEWWKGSFTFVGINRKWYNIIGRVSGSRATDGYLMKLGEAIGMPPIRPDVKFLHLQRGRKTMHYDSTQTRIIYGLPDDGVSGGITQKNSVEPKYHWDVGIGKDRLMTDILKLLEWRKANEQ